MLRHNITDITYLLRNCLVGKKEKFHIFLIFFPTFLFSSGLICLESPDKYPAERGPLEAAPHRIHP